MPHKVILKFTNGETKIYDADTLVLNVKKFRPLPYPIFGSVKITKVISMEEISVGPRKTLKLNLDENPTMELNVQEMFENTKKTYVLNQSENRRPQACHTQ